MVFMGTQETNIMMIAALVAVTVIMGIVTWYVTNH